MAEVMPPVVQAQVVESQKIYPGQPSQVAVPVRGNAAARRQYMAARRGGDGSGRLRQVHYLIAFGIAVPIIVIVLLAVLLPREESGGKSSDDSGQSRHNAPGYCAASTSAEINQRVRPVWRYYLLFWPPRRSARVLGVLARGVLGLLTRTFDFRTGRTGPAARASDWRAVLNLTWSTPGPSLCWAGRIGTSSPIPTAS